MSGLLRVGPVRFNTSERAAISRVPSVTKQTRSAANSVRRVARRKAPKRTGAGSRSISVQRWYDKDTRVVSFRVTWDRAHFYMLFSEDGTGKVRAKHFLRDAAREVQGE